MKPQLVEDGGEPGWDSMWRRRAVRSCAMATHSSIWMKPPWQSHIIAEPPRNTQVRVRKEARCREMTATHSSLFFKVLGKAGLPSRSEAHASRLQHTPNQTAIPIWVFGFPRTGTTTAQAIIAQALSYNASFEPFSQSHATELGFTRAHELFLGKPTQETWNEYVTPAGVNAALSTMEGTAEGAEKRSVFEEYLDALYTKFGRNTVFKEIRLFGNLDAIERFHASRGIPWVCVCLNAHPLQSLYAYYRIGGLCSRAPGKANYPDLVYRYRIATYARLGLHEELRGLTVRSISDKLVVACLLDQAHMRAFAAKTPSMRIATCLADLPKNMATISEWAETPVARLTSIAIRPSQRFAKDVLFRRAIIRELSPGVRDALLRANHPIPPGLPRARPSLRQMATFLRFRLYE